MKIIGVCGSPKKKNSTSNFLLEQALLECQKQGLKTEVINLSELNFEGCHDCGLCKTKFGCSQKDDFTALLPKLSESEVVGFIFASPVYFGGMTAQLKMFFDRSLPIRRHGFLWEDKLVGAITIGGSRSGGQELTQFDIAKSSLVHGMIFVPDASPTSHFGASGWARHDGGIQNDEYAIECSKNVAKKICQTAKKLNA